MSKVDQVLGWKTSRLSFPTEFFRRSLADLLAEIEKQVASGPHAKVNQGAEVFGSVGVFR